MIPQPGQSKVEEPPKTTRPRLPATADSLLAIAVLLAIWKLGALYVDREIILPAPERVFQVFWGLLQSARFLTALAATAARGLLAFTIALTLGSLTGFLGGLSPRLQRWLQPSLLVIKATPVLAIVLLAMIWFPSTLVPVFSAVIMSYPIVATEISAGVRSVDRRLVEMAKLFRVAWLHTTLHIRIPAAAPHILAAARNALGLSWKVVVAGEVLSQPLHALGTGMQNARIMLETSEVFAWAAAGILLCALSDGIFDLLALAFRRKKVTG